MNYFLDCEFNGFNGELLSMGIIREDGYSMYCTRPIRGRCEPWVVENVVPVLYDVPAREVDILAFRVPNFLPHINRFFNYYDGGIHLHADNEQDFVYFCRELLGDTYTPSDFPPFNMHVRRVDAYPTQLEGCVQHNAWWDAMALRHTLTGGEHQPELF